MVFARARVYIRCVSPLAHGKGIQASRGKFTIFLSTVTASDGKTASFILFFGVFFASDSWKLITFSCFLRVFRLRRSPTLAASCYLCIRKKTKPTYDSLLATRSRRPFP